MSRKKSHDSKPFVPQDRPFHQFHRLMGRRVLASTLIMLILCPWEIIAEVKEYDFPLLASSKIIHYYTSYIVAPGRVDLSHVIFSGPSSNARNLQMEDGDDGTGEEEDNTGKDDDSVLDIVFFQEPTTCAKSNKECDWTKLGIGKSDDFGNVRWCCSDDAATLGFCNTKTQNGRLIIDESQFHGKQRVIRIPKTGKFSYYVPEPILSVDAGFSGKYILALANCNDYGRDVTISGPQVWKSKHGYLPGDYLYEWYFTIALTVTFGVLLVWYGCSMKIYQNSSIVIQNYILATIAMATAEMLGKSLDYFAWDKVGTRSYAAIFTWIIIRVFKNAISLCLVLMVALGWGVIRDSLGDQLKKIIFLGMLYAALALTEAITAVLYVKDVTTLHNETKEQELYDITRFLGFFVQVITVVFYYWILYALTGTMQYLVNMSQTRKLERYLHLRCVLLTSMIVALITAMVGIIELSSSNGIISENLEWAYEASWEINYTFVLISISIMWRPNPSAREYAFAMEVPIGGDIELDTNLGGREFDDDDDDDDNIDYVDNKEKEGDEQNGRTRLALS